MQKLETELLGVTLRGSDGDDTLISSNGVDFLESGKDADPFSYAMDGKNRLPDQNNAPIINNEGYNNTAQNHSHGGHASGVDEIMNAITIL